MKSKSKNNFLGKIIILIWIALLTLNIFSALVEASKTTERDRFSDEYLELRAAKINNSKDASGNYVGVNGKRQLIMELWGHNIDFEGFEIRFEYDSTKLQPSIISTSDPTKTNTTGTGQLSMDQYFKFESEFSSVLEFEHDTSENNASNVIVARMAFKFDDDHPTYGSIPTSDHIIDRDGTKAVKTTVEGGVKLGEMSFRMLTEEQFVLTNNKTDTQGYYFGLVPNGTAKLCPKTGIKIQLNDERDYDMDNSYDYHKFHIENSETVIFEDRTASKDATLNDLVVSSGEVNNDNPSESTYKEYDLNPKFQENKEAGTYTLTLMEYIDTLDIKATQSDAKSTMKVKVPKHDSDGNLVYESDGTTIEYEEKNMTDSVPIGVELNKLGDPDTEVTIIVTAEDGVSTESYKIVIKRPYGIIKGSVYTAPTDSKGIFKANVRVYKTSEVNNIIDKSQIVEGKPDDVHQKLLTLKSQDVKTNSDGSYEVYVIPGTYDILIDKPGYLDYIYESRAVIEGQTLDLGLKEILAGDTNKDGIIEITDYTTIVAAFGMADTDAGYSESMNFNDDNYVEISDYTALVGNYLEARKIEK